MNALRNIHAVLSQRGIVVDTQPISPCPRIAADRSTLGTLDMRDWAGTVRAVDERIDQVVAAGLFEFQHEDRFIVTDSFDSGAECLEAARTWRGTLVPRSLASSLARAPGAVTVEQEVRLRLLRRSNQ